MNCSLFAALLLFAMTALHCGISESMDYIEGNCNDVIKLPCKATNQTTTYRYAIWYKMKVSYFHDLICLSSLNVSLFFSTKDFLSKKEKGI